MIHSACGCFSHWFAGRFVLKIAHQELDDTRCYLGFFLLCARHIGLRFKDKMVMLEKSFPVCHLCLGMGRGADSQNSTTNGLRVGRRESGGSFLQVPAGCGQRCLWREGASSSQATSFLFGFWAMVKGFACYSSPFLGLSGGQISGFFFFFFCIKCLSL